LLQAGDVDGASEAFAACLTLRRELVARDRSNSEWRRDLSVALERVGDVHSLQGRHEAASAAFSEALSLREATLTNNAADVVATRDLAILWMRLGKARANAHTRLSEIDAAYAKAISLLSPLVEKAPPESRWRRDLAVAYAERGEARRRAGKISSARSDMRAALDLITKLRAAAPDDVQLE
jgi:tetratricopeptide (TPR) repeat protein